MAFPLLTIFLSVFENHHFHFNLYWGWKNVAGTLLNKKFRKREKLITVLKENNGEPCIIVWQILYICKASVFPIFIDNTKCNSLKFEWTYINLYEIFLVIVWKSNNYVPVVHTGSHEFLHLSMKIVVFNKIQYIYIGTLKSSVSFVVGACKKPSKSLIAWKLINSLETQRTVHKLLGAF